MESSSRTYEEKYKKYERKYLNLQDGSGIKNTICKYFSAGAMKLIIKTRFLNLILIIFFQLSIQ